MCVSVCVCWISVRAALSHTAGPCCLHGSHVRSYSKTYVVFWNSSILPSKNSCVTGEVVSVDEDMFRGFLRESVLHIRLFITTHKAQNSPRAALSLILGLVVTDSKLLCHLFFPCCYFLPPPPFSNQTIQQLLRKENDASRITISQLEYCMEKTYRCQGNQ